MKVLSLFDGISCGRLAFERAGIPVEKYYASEIDKYAMQVAQRNYPDTIQVGDVTKLNYLELLDVDMVIGGSPCQDLSIAKQNRQGLRGERSGLFWKFVEALEVIHPKYFLLENVASMRNEDRDAITATLKKIYPETECIMINSALVSAQQRKRYYWTNWHVEQPPDKGILLKDILESGYGCDVENQGKKLCKTVDKTQTLMARDYKGFGNQRMTGVAVPCAMRTREDELGKFKRLETKYDGKANSLTSVQTDSMVVVNIDNYFRKYGTKGKIMSADTEKTQCLTASMGCGGGNNPLVAEPVNINGTDYKFYPSERQTKTELDYLGGVISGRKQWLEDDTYKSRSFSQGNRVYSVHGKSVSLNANGGGGGAKTGLYKVDLPDGDYIIRKLTPVECERLQTLPDFFTKYGAIKWNYANLMDAFSPSQAGKLNSVINTIFDSYETELRNLAENWLIKQKTASKTDAKTNNKLLWGCVSNIIKSGSDNNQLILPKNVQFVMKSLGKDVVECALNTTSNGKNTETLYIMKLENTNPTATKEQNIISLQTVDGCIKQLLNKCLGENSNQTRLFIISTLINLIIVKAIFLCAKLTGSIYVSIDNSNISLGNSLEMELSGLRMENITEISNSSRYKAIGNGWTVDVIAWILSQIPKD